MDQLLILYVLIYAGVISLFVFPVILVWHHFWYFKPLARRLNYILRKKIPSVTMAYDSGITDIIPLKDITHQGILKGAQMDQYFIVPQAILKEESKSSLESESREDPYGYVVTRRFVWKDSGAPTFLGYAGRIAIFPPSTLASIEASEVFKNPENVQAKNLFPTLLLDPRKLRNYINASMSTISVKGIMLDIEERLRREYSGRQFGRSLMMFMIFLLVAVIALKIAGFF